MRLRGIEFGPTFIGAGGVNFEGQGYQAHQLFKLLPGFKLGGATPIMKTIVLPRRQGNLDLNPKTLMPKFKRPRRAGRGWIVFGCIYVDFNQELVLNAVSLSGPGASIYFERGRVQNLTEPFFLSWMPVSETPTGRLMEAEEFAWLLAKYRPGFKSRFGLFVNISCPNTSHCSGELAAETVTTLRILRDSHPDLPLGVKPDAATPAAVLKEIEKSGCCDLLDVSQSVKWGWFPELIDWEGLFGGPVSPLARLGGGGLTGRPVQPVNAGFIRKLRREGIRLPIIGGGGVLEEKDPAVYKEAGADGCVIGSQLILRPRGVGETVAYSNKIF